MGRIIKAMFLSFFIGLFCGSCITNSSFNFCGVVHMQSAENNEAATKKEMNEENVKPEEKKGTLRKLLDWWL